MIVTVLYYIREFLKYLFELPDFYIECVSINYNADDIVELKEIEKIPYVWTSQSYYWNSNSSMVYHWDITSRVRTEGIDYLNNIISNIPSNVHDIVYTIKYTYNSKSYKYISTDETPISWPYKRGNIRCISPILSVWGIDKFGNEVKEITKHVRKAGGPKGDFHGQDVKIMDIMKYDYKRIKVKYLLTEKIFDENDSVFNIIN